MALRRLVGLVVLALFMPLLAPLSGAQPASAARLSATTLEALVTYPGFFHLKNIAVRGVVEVKGDQARLIPQGGVERGVRLAFSSSELPAEGPTEVRGLFWDVGRLSPEEPQAGGFDIKRYTESLFGERWPARGELLTILVSSTTPVPTPPTAPRLRHLALDPERYEGQVVTVRGQFSGRNLLGDLPQAPRISRFDFVVRSAGAAVWVTGLEPKGKGWKLGLDTKLDTNTWLEVKGTLRRGNGLVWLEATNLNQAKPEDDVATDVGATPVVPPAPPPEVTFSLPSGDETDVSSTITVRFQVTRDLDPETLKGNITATYLGDAAATPIPLKATFDRAARVLEVAFEKPLERFRTVVLDLTDRVKGTDGQPLKPHRLTFSVGGNDLGGTTDERR
jgi:hypothetical protein